MSQPCLWVFGVSEHGKLGCVCVDRSVPGALRQYEEVRRVLDDLGGGAARA